MRIDSIELVNFGSHRHSLFVPGDARLVVITGPNGVGKTTLASEALHYAFFKDARGTVNAGVRNGATDSAVTIEFSFAGASYRAIRRRTTRGAGQSSADLHRQEDGRWTKVATGDKEVPTAVRELLRMDAGTFRSSVSLEQKKLDRFVLSSSTGRKEILAEIVVDPRFAPAAEIAGRRAVTLERQAAVDRADLQRTSDTIAELEPVRVALVGHRELLAITAALIEEARAARATASERLAVVNAQLAASAGIPGEQLRLTAERDELLATWNRMTARHDASVIARDRATGVLDNGEAIEAAVLDVVAARADVDRLAAGEATDRRLAGEISVATAALEEVDRPQREAVTTWKTKRGLEEARIRELEEHARAGTSVCATCGQPIEAKQALAQLRDARDRFAALGDEPKSPLEIARRSAAVSRLESRRRELAWDPAALAVARDRLTGLERLAARADGLAEARATVERETAAVADAKAELERIRIRGETVKTRLDEVNSHAAAMAPLRSERAALQRAIADAETLLEARAAQRRDAEGRIARAEAHLERLEQLAADRDRLAATIADAEIRIGRLRKVAAACGLKGAPARMIERVLPELSRHANDVLSSLFGLELEIRAQRAAADGKSSIEALDLVIRSDEAGELELARISGGQETAVSLALAIGLSRLNARRAGTAIRTLVIDEPDGLDTRRLRALGEALRILAHEGELERIFLITHTTELAGYADLVVDLRPSPDGAEMFIDGIRSQPDELAAAAA